MSNWISALKISLDWHKLSLSYRKWSEIEILAKKSGKNFRLWQDSNHQLFSLLGSPGHGAPTCATIPKGSAGFFCNLLPFPSPFVERAKGSEFKCSLATIFWLNGDFFRYLEKITIFVTWTLRNLHKGATFCRWSRILGRILLFNSS